MASSPSPVAELPSTPPAPKFGSYYDTWEPWQPRKSARIANRTPSPRAATHRQARNTDGDAINGNMSPRKKRQPAADAVNRVSGEKSSTGSSQRKRTGTDTLLTPAKTPRKPPTAKQAAEMASVSRKIFPSSDDALLNGRAKRAPKKISGSTLESFVAEDAEQEFAIYNDPCNRIPQKDDSNPFYNPPANQSPERRSKQKQIMIPGEGLQDIEKAAGREDGMLMKL